MPAILSNAKDFLLNSDFPQDKVVLLKSGSMSVGASSTVTVDIPHGLPFRPLVGGNWSTSSTFSLSLDYGTGTFPSPSPGSLFAHTSSLTADATNVSVTSQNTTGSTTTFYYRIFGLEPSTSSAELGGTASSGDELTLSSDYNLVKLYLNAYVDQAATGGSPVTQVIPHNLGYRPQVLAWKELSGIIYPLTEATPSASGYQTSVKVTTASISIIIQAFAPAQRIHYRVYLDD